MSDALLVAYCLWVTRLAFILGDEAVSDEAY